MPNELIEECLSYIEQLTNFLKDKDYWIDDYDAHIASLRQKYATSKLVEQTESYTYTYTTVIGGVGVILLTYLKKINMEIVIKTLLVILLIASITGILSSL